MRWLLALVLLLSLSAPALAVRPDEMLADAGLEARARTISEGIRCLVCQNQSIDSSDADLARDLRVIVRERLTAGDNDDQVRAFLVTRYGEYVLLNPVIAPHTLALWIAGPLVLLGGAAMVFIAARRKRKLVTGVSELTAEEAEALKGLEGE